MSKVRNVSRELTMKAYDRAMKVRRNNPMYVASAVAAISEAKGKNLATVGLAIPKGKVLENLGKYVAMLTNPEAKENKYWGFIGSNNFDANTLEGIYNESIEIDFPGFDKFTDDQKTAFGVVGAWIYFKHLKEVQLFGGLTKLEYDFMLEDAYAEKRKREHLAWELANGITEETKARDAAESDRLLAEFAKEFGVYKEDCKEDSK